MATPCTGRTADDLRCVMDQGHAGQCRFAGAPIGGLPDDAVVDAVIYCAERTCLLPDGHDGPHTPGPCPARGQSDTMASVEGSVRADATATINAAGRWVITTQMPDGIHRSNGARLGPTLDIHADDLGSSQGCEISGNELHVTYDMGNPTSNQAVGKVGAARHELERAKEAVAVRTRDAAGRLRDHHGLSAKDISIVLGVTPAEASAFLAAYDEAGPRHWGDDEAPAAPAS